MPHTIAPRLTLVLERIGGELAEQAEAVRGLHALAEGRPSDETLVSAQTIDTSSQHLAELGALMRCLAASAGETEAPLPCFEAMTLSGLRARVLGEAEEQAESGEVDFF